MNPVIAEDALVLIDGYLAVDLFFLLSGMVISHVYLARIRGGRDGFRSFVVRRLARLWPLQVLTLNVIALVYYAHYAIFDEKLSPCKFDAYSYLLNLLFAQSSFWSHGCSFNAPSWTLSIEMFLYLGFFLVAWTVRIRPVWFLVIAGYGLWMVYSATYNHGIQPNYGRGVFAFYLGVGLLPAFKCFIDALVQWSRTRQLQVIGGVAVAFVLLVYLRREVIGFDRDNYQLFDFYRMYPRLVFYDLLMFPVLVMLFGGVAALTRETWLSRFLGNVSYSSYLLHVPLMLSIKFGFALLGFDLVYFQSTAGWCTYVALLLLMSYLSYEYYETPSRKWMVQKLAGGRRTAGA